MNKMPILVSPTTFTRSAIELLNMRPAPVMARSGSSGVLVTCVHGLGHLRNGTLKLRDSGSLETSHVLALAAEADWLAVGVDGAVDSNYHRDTEFKRALAERLKRQPPKLVVDIHTSDAQRPFDVEIGSIDQASWLGNLYWRDALHHNLAVAGFFVSDNQVFKAAGATPGPQTITAFCMEQGVPAVQLEISSALTDELYTLQARHAQAKLVNAIAAALSGPDHAYTRQDN